MGFACDCIAAKMGSMKMLMSLLVCAGLWGQSGLRKIGDLGAGAEVYVYTDTANVYVIRQGERAMLIDVGDGGVLAELPKIGVKQLEWVLFTHHHREQVQGAAKLKDWNVKVAVPEAEREFFENPMAFRKMKASLADRFAVHGASYLRVPRERIAVDRGFAKMDDFEWGGLQFHCVETKGNSPGAMSYLVKTPTGWVAFVGDLIVDGARMHTWFDTEWDYGFAAGIFPLVESAALIEQFDPVLVAPSHGPMIRDGRVQLAELQKKLRAFEPLYVRGYPVFRYAGADQDRTSKPTEIPHVWQVLPHVYKFKGPNYGVNFYLILAESGKGLLVDCGLVEAQFLDRTLERMREKLGLKSIDACIVSHMHGDHMLNTRHLREKWGVKVWALDNMVDKMERPERYDYAAAVWAYPQGLNSVKVDRSFKPGESLDWEGYRFTIDWMPGQTEFALAVRGVIDGKKVVFTGDNLFGDPRDPKQSGHEAVVARNSSIFEEGYIYGAEYLKRIAPDLLLGGHSYVMDQPAGMIERYRQWSYDIRDAFRGLASDKDYQYWYDPFWVRAEPYRIRLVRGGSSEFDLHVRNFRTAGQRHRVEVRTPAGVSATPEVLQGELAAEARGVFRVNLTAGAEARLGVQLVTFDITLDGKRYGEYFDLIVEVVP